MLEVGFSQPEFRVQEGSGQLDIPFLFFNPVDPSTLPGTVFVSLQVAVVEGTAMCKRDDVWMVIFVENWK